MLYLKTASLTASSQYSVGSWQCASAPLAEFMMVRFMRSSMEFSCGVYGVDGLKWIPRLARNCWTYLAVYSFALSVVMIVRYLARNRSSASIDVVRACGTYDLVVRNEMKVYRVAVSISVMKYMLRCVAFGVIGPQKSDEILCPIIVVCCARLCGAALVLPSMKSVHVIFGGGCAGAGAVG